MVRSQRPNPAIGKKIVAVSTGLKGRITDVEHHASSPWIRYGVEFEDGSTAAGFVIGKDMRLDPGASS